MEQVLPVEALAVRCGEHVVVRAEGEGEEAEVVRHQLYLNVDHLAWPVTPRYRTAEHRIL